MDVDEYKFRRDLLKALQDIAKYLELIAERLNNIKKAP